MSSRWGIANKQKRQMFLHLPFCVGIMREMPYGMSLELFCRGINIKNKKRLNTRFKRFCGAAKQI